MAFLAFTGYGGERGIMVFRVRVLQAVVLSTSISSVPFFFFSFYYCCWESHYGNGCAGGMGVFSC